MRTPSNHKSGRALAWLERPIGSLLPL